MCTAYMPLYCPISCLLYHPQQLAPPAHSPVICLPSPPTHPLSLFPPHPTVQHGGYGSIGYGYDWKVAEAEKNLLRTHTTAVSSRMLYKLAQVGQGVMLSHVLSHAVGPCMRMRCIGMTRFAALGIVMLTRRSALPPAARPSLAMQEGFRPAKYFSIDRVFRNEAIDRTHLAEFHQIEGGWGVWWVAGWVDGWAGG